MYTVIRTSLVISAFITVMLVHVAQVFMLLDAYFLKYDSFTAISIVLHVWYVLFCFLLLLRVPDLSSLE